MKTRTSHGFLAAALCLLLSACATSPIGRTQFMLISPEAAIVESRKAYISTVEELRQDNQLLDDPLLADRVGLVTGRLVTEAIKQFPHSATWEWSVALIDDPETINAWCMAGGRMAIYSGFFEKLKLTDDELAHIMGHEIAHALANHTAESISIALASGLVVELAQAMTDDEGVGTATELAAMLAVDMPISRSSEREADQMGIELGTLAGYRPEAAVTLWEKMEQEGGDDLPEFLSTHPSPDNRREDLAEMIPAMNAIRPPTLSPPHPVQVIIKRRTP